MCMHRRKMVWTHSKKVWTHSLQAKGRGLGRNQACRHLDITLPASRTVRKFTSAVLAAQSVVFHYGNPGKLMHLGWEWSSSYRKDSFSENVLSAHCGRRSGLKKAAVVLPFLKCGVLGGGRGVYFTNTPSTSSDSAIPICQRQAGRLCNASPLASMNQGYFHQHFIKAKAYASSILPNTWEAMWTREGGDARKDEGRGADSAALCFLHSQAMPDAWASGPAPHISHLPKGISHSSLWDNFLLSVHRELWAIFGQGKNVDSFTHWNINHSL